MMQNCLQICTELHLICGATIWSLTWAPGRLPNTLSNRPKSKPSLLLGLEVWRSVDCESVPEDGRCKVAGQSKTKVSSMVHLCSKIFKLTALQSNLKPWTLRQLLQGWRSRGLTLVAKVVTHFRHWDLQTLVDPGAVAKGTRHSLKKIKPEQQHGPSAGPSKYYRCLNNYQNHLEVYFLST